MKKILNVCSAENTAKGIRDAAIIAIGLGCELRRTEIAELEISNIDLDSELRSSLRNFESQNEYGYKPCIKKRFQNAETLQSRNQKNSS